MRLAIFNPTEVEEYLTLECKLGRVVGPIGLAAHSHVQRNRFGVIPKPQKPESGGSLLTHPGGVTME